MSRKEVVPQESCPERFCRCCSEWTRPEGPSGPTPARSLGPSHQGHGHLCPLPCAPGPTPEWGSAPAGSLFVPVVHSQPECPALPPCPQSPLAGEEKQGLHVPSGPGPSYPSYRGALDCLKRGQPGGPALLTPLLPCPLVSCGHVQKQ